MNKINEYSLSDDGKTETLISINLIKILQTIDTKKIYKKL